MIITDEESLFVLDTAFDELQDGTFCYLNQGQKVIEQHAISYRDSEGDECTALVITVYENKDKRAFSCPNFSHIGDTSPFGDYHCTYQAAYINEDIAAGYQYFADYIAENNHLRDFTHDHN